MENGQLNWIANFIWGIADDVLRDVHQQNVGRPWRAGEDADAEWFKPHPHRGATQ